jgi:DNA-binding response OmpR family regulator
MLYTIIPRRDTVATAGGRQEARSRGASAQVLCDFRSAPREILWSAAMIYGFHDCTLDQDRHELHCAGQVVSVEPKVFQVLLYLL